jgi:hypothetical protein
MVVNKIFRLCGSNATSGPPAGDDGGCFLQHSGMHGWGKLVSHGPDVKKRSRRKADCAVDAW